MTEEARRLRVAVYDRGGGQGDWLGVLGRQSVDLVRAQSLHELASSDADHVVAWLTPDEAAASPRTWPVVPRPPRSRS